MSSDASYRAGGSRGPLEMRGRSPGIIPGTGRGSVSPKNRRGDVQIVDLAQGNRIIDRLENNQPGSVAIGYLTRSVWKAPPGNYARSKSHGKQPGGNFKAIGRKLEERLIAKYDRRNPKGRGKNQENRGARRRRIEEHSRGRTDMGRGIQSIRPKEPDACNSAVIRGGSSSSRS